MTAPQRHPTFNHLFSLMGECHKPTIVETGTIRAFGDAGLIGDGHSTLKFADYCSKFGGKVYSVDIDPEAVALSSWMVSRKYPDVEVNVIHSDSVAFLESFDEPIDVLYLDSDNDANLILNEAKAALGCLHEDSIILIDDCFCEVKKETHGIQKGDLAIPFLEENGWTMINVQYQALFIHEDRF
jgi:predicted O-methyltransferase YrrM